VECGYYKMRYWNCKDRLYILGGWYFNENMNDLDILNLLDWRLLVGYWMYMGSMSIYKWYEWLSMWVYDWYDNWCDV